MQTLTLIRPDDMHLHLRDGDALRAVLPFTARQMGRAVIMPNLKPPVVSVADALAYQQRIQAALPAGSRFQPLMTLYLTDKTTPALVREAKAAGIMAFKLYPAGPPPIPIPALPIYSNCCRYCRKWRRNNCCFWCTAK